MTRRPPSDTPDPLQEAAIALLGRFGDRLDESIQVYKELSVEENRGASDFEHYCRMAVDLDSVRTLLNKISGRNPHPLTGDENSFLLLDPPLPGDPLRTPRIRRDALGLMSEDDEELREGAARGQDSGGFPTQGEIESRERITRRADQSAAPHEQFRSLAILYQGRGQAR